MVRQAVKTSKNLLFENRQAFYSGKEQIKKNVSLNLGWGKLLFAQTYHNPKTILKQLLEEPADTRNLAFYVQKPQVLLALGKGKIFLDPSLAYRLNLTTYNHPNIELDSEIQVRLLTKKDIKGVNYTYKESKALPIDLKNTLKNQRSKAITYFIAEKKGKVIGIVIGVDHKELFNSPEGGRAGSR